MEEMGNNMYIALKGWWKQYSWLWFLCNEYWVPDCERTLPRSQSHKATELLTPSPVHLRAFLWRSNGSKTICSHVYLPVPTGSELLVTDGIWFFFFLFLNSRKNHSAWYTRGIQYVCWVNIWTDMYQSKNNSQHLENILLLTWSHSEHQSYNVHVFSQHTSLE